MKSILDLGVIVVVPDLHPCKMRHIITQGLAHHLFHREKNASHFIKDSEDFLNSLEVRERGKGSRSFRRLPSNPRKETKRNFEGRMGESLSSPNSRTG